MDPEKYVYAENPEDLLGEHYPQASEEAQRIFDRFTGRMALARDRHFIRESRKAAFLTALDIHKQFGDWRNCPCMMAIEIRQWEPSFITDEERHLDMVFTEKVKAVSSLSISELQDHIVKMDKLRDEINKEYAAVHTVLQFKLSEASDEEKKAARKRDQAYKVRPSTEETNGTSPNSSKPRAASKSKEEKAIESLMATGFSREAAMKMVSGK